MHEYYRYIATTVDTSSVSSSKAQTNTQTLGAKVYESLCTTDYCTDSSSPSFYFFLS